MDRASIQNTYTFIEHMNDDIMFRSLFFDVRMYGVRIKFAHHTIVSHSSNPFLFPDDLNDEIFTILFKLGETF